MGSQKYVLEEIVEGMARGITIFVILKSRQLGISTLFLALDLFWAFEHWGTLGVFATHDEGSRDQFRNQIEVFLTGLPKSHKIPYNVNNRLMLVLDAPCLSIFRYLVAGTRTTAVDATVGAEALYVSVGVRTTTPEATNAPTTT